MINEWLERDSARTALSGSLRTCCAAASSTSPRHRKQSATIGLTPSGPTLESAEQGPFCALAGPLRVRWQKPRDTVQHLSL
jgi:hypothetical protein